jgi:hypothetical protein
LVVALMCICKIFEYRNLFVAKQAQTAMNVNIVHQEVSKAVCSDSDTRWYECGKRGLIEADSEQDVDASGQDDGEEIVRLEQRRNCAGRIAVVAFVEELGEPVHYPAVGAIGKGFHEHECQGHYQQVSHSTTR